VSEPSGRRRRRLLPAFLIVLVLAAAGLAAVVVGVLTLEGDLREGRSSLEAGRRALLAGRIPEAANSFEAARNRFRSAAAGTDSGLPAIGGAVPILGRSIDVLAALAQAGERSAQAGATISAAIEDLPDGIDGLTSSRGVIALDALGPLGTAVASAETDVGAAVEAVRSSPAGLLPGPVADARRLAIERLGGFERLLGSARALSTALPRFAGGVGPRRYLFFAEDPAELRGTGGLWGAYSIVRAERGRFTFSAFRPTQTLGDLPAGVVPPPSPEYLTNYERYGAPGYWINSNMTPDLPSAARVALASWVATGRDPLDGVITADPFALKDLLTVTGRVRLGFPPLALTRENVIPLLTNRAFARFPDPAVRKAVLGDAARAVLDRFLTIDGRVVPRIRALSRAFSDGHLKIYAANPSVESALDRAGVDGALDAEGGDLVSVIVNAGAGVKVDYFSRRTVRHEVTLLAGGSATATTAITIENDAPTSGQPPYVIGPHRGEAGDNIPLVAVFCGARCTLVRAEREGEPVSLREGSELGYRLYRDYFTIPSGEDRTLTVTTESRGAWTGDASAGSYRLTVVGQTTIRPTVVTVVIRAPLGMRFTSSSDDVVLERDRATWTGVLGDELRIELSFERRPLLERLWSALSGADRPP
jgi:hypothetical protein